MTYRKKIISVIIPIYNVEKYLRRCLDSVIANTYKDLEIICINDGSTDSCLEILNNYKRQDPRIIIIDKPNGGLSSARNSGLKAATGEYVAFIDSDDWVHPQYFEYLLKALTKYDADFSMCDYFFFNDDILPSSIPNSTYTVNMMTIDDLLKTNFKLGPSVWKRLYKHTAIKDLFFDETEKIEDADYLIRLFISNPNLKISYINMPLYAYYKRANSLASFLTEEMQLAFAEKQLNFIHATDSKKLKALIADSAIKRAIGARFAFLALKDKKNTNRCNAVIKNCLPYKFTFKNIILGLFPTIYRFTIIKLDPTMKTYEKQLKIRKYK